MLFRGPRATGALVFPDLAGPVEFSTGEIMLLLLVVMALVFVFPLLAGTVAVVLYRRRTPTADRNRRAATLQFLKWAAIAFVVQFPVGRALEALSGLG